MRAAFTASLGDPGADAIAEDLSLELREDRQHPGHRATGRGGHVEGLGQVLRVTFTPTSTDFAPVSGSVAIDVTPTGLITPTVTVADAGGTYNGSAFPATATVAGVDGVAGPSLEGVAPTLTYYVGASAGGSGSTTAPVVAGTYTVVASFPGSVHYAAAQSAPQTFTIAARPLTVTANDASRVYGSPNPAFTASYAGFAPGEGPGALAGTLTFQTSATADSPDGRYPIVPAGLTSGNYAITFVPGTLTVVAGGPQVTDVQRFGYHIRPTSLVVTFSDPLDPARATDLANYRLVLRGGHRPLRLASASLSADGRVVTLRPSRLLPLKYHYQLTVVGTPPGGLTDTPGRYLDGVGDGRPGTDYTTTITRKNLAVAPTRASVLPHGRSAHPVPHGPVAASHLTRRRG